MSITIFLADDHPMLIDGLRRTFLGEGFDVVGMVHTVNEVADRYFELRPDVLLVDIRFEHSAQAKTGLDVCVEILEKDPAARILVFSQFDSPYVVQESYRIGALAFVRKDESPDVLVAAARAVAQGQQYFSREAANIMNAPATRDLALAENRSNLEH